MKVFLFVCQSVSFLCICWWTVLLDFFPRCMECHLGLAMRRVSVCPSVCVSVKLVNIVTKQKRHLSRFLMPYVVRSFSLLF